MSYHIDCKTFRKKKKKKKRRKLTELRKLPICVYTNNILKLEDIHSLKGQLEDLTENHFYTLGAVSWHNSNFNIWKG